MSFEDPLGPVPQSMWFGRSYPILSAGLRCDLDISQSAYPISSPVGSGMGIGPSSELSRDRPRLLGEG